MIDALSTYNITPYMRLAESILLLNIINNIYSEEVFTLLMVGDWEQ